MALFDGEGFTGAFDEGARGLGEGFTGAFNGGARGLGEVFGNPAFIEGLRALGEAFAGALAEGPRGLGETFAGCFREGVANGLPIYPGATLLAGVGALAANAILALRGQAALAGVGALAAAATERALGAAAAAGVGSLTANAIERATGAAALAGVGALAGATQVKAAAGAGLPGTGALGASGAVQTAGAAALAGTGTLGAAAGVRAAGAASLAGAGALAADTHVIEVANANLPGGGGLIADGQVIAPSNVLTAQVNLPATGALSAAATVNTETQIARAGHYVGTLQGIRGAAGSLAAAREARVTLVAVNEYAGSVGWAAAVAPPVSPGAASFFSIQGDGTGASTVNCAISRTTPGVFAEVIADPYPTNDGIMAGPVGTVVSALAASELAGAGAITTTVSGPGVAGFTFSQAEIAAGDFHSGAVVIGGVLGWAEGITFQRISIGRYRFSFSGLGNFFGGAYLVGVVTAITPGIWLAYDSSPDPDYFPDVVCCDVDAALVDASVTVLFPKATPTAHVPVFAIIGADGSLVDGYGLAAASHPSTGRYRITLSVGIPEANCSVLAFDGSGDNIGRCYAVDHVSDSIKDIRWGDRGGSATATAFTVMVYLK